MGWFTPKCPVCAGPLQATGYSAPYPSYRCLACIRAAEVKQLREALNSQVPHD